jgi:hypothetical protein
MVPEKKSGLVPKEKLAAEEFYFLSFCYRILIEV